MARRGKDAYQVQYALQEMMQDLVGIVRTEAEMQRALVGLEALRERARKVGVGGHREYNPGWHAALDLPNLLLVSEAVTRAAIERRESRGGHFREDYPDKDARVRQNKYRPAERARRANGADARADSGDAGRTEGNHRGDEVESHIHARATMPDSATFRIWRGGGEGGKFEDYTTPVSEGMVVLDAVFQIQANQANDLAVRWNCKAGKCGSCSAEVNGNPRLMCMTRLNQLNLAEPVTIEPMRSFPAIRDLVTDVSWNFRAKKRIKPFSPRPPDAPDGTWRVFQADVERVQEFRKCIECFLCQDVCHVLREHQLFEPFVGPRYLVYAAALEMHPLDGEDRTRQLKNEQRHRLLQHHEMLHEGVSRRTSPLQTMRSSRSKNV